MPSITDLVRSLGNDKALNNARILRDIQHLEDWLVSGLLHRLAERDAAAVPSAARDLVA